MTPRWDPAENPYRDRYNGIPQGTTSLDPSSVPPPEAPLGDPSTGPPPPEDPSMGTLEGVPWRDPLKGSPVGGTLEWVSLKVPL